MLFLEVRKTHKEPCFFRLFENIWLGNRKKSPPLSVVNAEGAFKKVFFLLKVGLGKHAWTSFLLLCRAFVTFCLNNTKLFQTTDFALSSFPKKAKQLVKASLSQWRKKALKNRFRGSFLPSWIWIFLEAHFNPFQKSLTPVKAGSTVVEKKALKNRFWSSFATTLFSKKSSKTCESLPLSLGKKTLKTVCRS